MAEVSVIKVQYKIKEEYIEENKLKIMAVMDDLKELNNPNIKYSSYHMGDGSFMHIVMYNGEDAKQLPSSLESFKQFQAGLKENIVEPPKAENFTLVDSSFDLF